jgi:hypothetical protein
MNVSISATPIRASLAHVLLQLKESSQAITENVKFEGLEEGVVIPYYYIITI